MKSDLIDIEVRKLAETSLAVLVSTTDDEEDSVWIPKSQCEFEPESGSKYITLTLPEWLAHDKDLI